MDVNGRQEIFSLDSLKPAYLDIQSPKPSPTSDSRPKSSPPKLAEHSTHVPSVPSSEPFTTTINPLPTGTTNHSGHRVHWPQRLNL